MRLVALAALAWIAGAGLTAAQGVDVKARDAQGATALLWAAHDDDVEQAKKLLAAGADPKAANDYGATPMSEAAALGSAAASDIGVAP